MKQQPLALKSTPIYFWLTSKLIYFPLSSYWDPGESPGAIGNLSQVIVEEGDTLIS